MTLKLYSGWKVYREKEKEKRIKGKSSLFTPLVSAFILGFSSRIMALSNMYVLNPKFLTYAPIFTQKSKFT